jgi:hypothetical protein
MIEDHFSLVKVFEMFISRKGSIVFLCLLAAAALLLVQITSLKQVSLIFFIIAGMSLALALYQICRQTK